MAEPVRAVRVPVSMLDLDLIEDQALFRFNQMRGRRTSYGRSTMDMQRVGLLGEHAVAAWLNGRGYPCRSIDDAAGAEPGSIEAFGRDAPADYDLAFLGRPGRSTKAVTTVEVKTSRYRDWLTWGRSISAAQLGRTQAHVFVWCVVADELPTTSVIVMGWCPTQALLDGAVESVEGEPSRVVASEPLRAMSDLVEFSGWRLRR